MTDQEWAERFTAAQLDPDAPDPWRHIPSRYLTSQGFAIRLLRVIAGLERDGTPPEVTLRTVQRHCRELVERPQGER